MLLLWVFTHLFLILALDQSRLPWAAGSLSEEHIIHAYYGNIANSFRLHLAMGLILRLTSHTERTPFSIWYVCGIVEFDFHQRGAAPIGRNPGFLAFFGRLFHNFHFRAYHTGGIST